MATSPTSSAHAATRSGCSLLIAIGIFLFLLIAHPWVTVPAGHRMVLFDLSGGTQERQLGEGTHFILPFVQKTIPYDVRTQTYTMSATSWEGEVKGDDSLKTLTSDGQEVRVDISVRFHPDADKIYLLHQRVGQDYINKVIRPEVRSQTRFIFAEYPVNDVYSSKREMIQQQLADRLRQKFQQNYIVLDEVLLRDIQFSPAFADAIELKQIAQQNAQRMQYVLERAEKEKQIKILEAQGEARSIELRGQAIAQNPRVVQYEYARKIAPNVAAVITDGRDMGVPFSAPVPKP